MEYYISECRECPMFNDGMDGEYQESCQHPTTKGKELPLTEALPEWCPLISEPITINKKG